MSLHNYRVYISGPISGKENGNRSAFTHAERFLRAIGAYPENPHRIAPHHIRGASDECMGGNSTKGSEHGDGCYLRGDIKRQAECDAIYMLEGWQKSPGARLELANAIQFGMDIFFEGPGNYDIMQSELARSRSREG